MKRIVLMLLFCLMTVCRLYSQGSPVGTSTIGNQGHSDVMTFYVNDDLHNEVRIETNIPYNANNITTVYIKGYDHGNSATINLQVGWRKNESEFGSAAASNAGGVAPQITLVKSVKDEREVISIILNFWGSFTRFEVTAFADGLGEQHEWYRGWSVLHEDGAKNYTDVYPVGYYNQFGDVGANNISADNISANNIYGSFVGTWELSSYGNSYLHNLYVNNGAIHSNYNGWRPYGMYFARHNNHFSQNAYYDGLWRSYASGGEYSSAMIMQTASADGKAFRLLVDNTITAANQPLDFTDVFNVDLNGNTEVKGKLFVGNVTPTNISNLSSYSFAVNGSALFTKATVKLYGNWPDYVFKPDYKLRPLSEVESYIKKYSHLPEVTPAADIEKNGIDLGTSQSELLKKVEELTLYAIEQDKKLKLLEDKLNKLLAEKK